MLDCGCFSVTSFDEYVRSSPKAYGVDSYAAYQDYGPGMPRGVVYLVIPLPDSQYENVGSILRASDQRRRAFWEEAQKQSGDLAEGSVWEAYVPPDVREMSSSSRIVDREAVVVRGTQIRRCGQRFLVAAMGNPLLLGELRERDWEVLREEYAKFTGKIKWVD